MVFCKDTMSVDHSISACWNDRQMSRIFTHCAVVHYVVGLVSTNCMLLVLHVTFIHKVSATLIDKMSKATIAALKRKSCICKTVQIGEKK